MLAKVPLASMLVPVKLLLELFSCEKVVLDSGACPLYYLPRHAINFYMLPYLLLLTHLAFTVSLTISQFRRNHCHGDPLLWSLVPSRNVSPGVLTRRVSFFYLVGEAVPLITNYYRGGLSTPPSGRGLYLPFLPNLLTGFAIWYEHMGDY